jgi:hypothetical protein
VSEQTVLGALNRAEQALVGALQEMEVAVSYAPDERAFRLLDNIADLLNDRLRDVREEQAARKQARGKALRKPAPARS